MDKLREQSQFHREEEKTATAQICPECGEPVFPPETIHECGRITRIVNESRDKQKKTLYPALDRALRETKKLWSARKTAHQSMEVELNPDSVAELGQLQENTEIELPKIHLEKQPNYPLPIRKDWDTEHPTNPAQPSYKPDRPVREDWDIGAPPAKK